MKHTEIQKLFKDIIPNLGDRASSVCHKRLKSGHPYFAIRFGSRNYLGIEETEGEDKGKESQLLFKALNFKAIEFKRLTVGKNKKIFYVSPFNPK